MDKTTTWLIRGAALTVIFVGFFNYLEPEMKRQSEIKSNSDRKHKSFLTQARCEDFPKISESRFRSLYEKDYIIQALFFDNLPMQINTISGNFLTDLYPTQDLLKMLKDKKIVLRIGGSRMCR